VLAEILEILSEGVRVKVAGLAQLHQPPARYRNPADVCYHGLNV